MKRISVIFTTIALILGGFLFNSCNRAKDIIPSAEYAPYISAYTGGLLSSKSTVIIAFTEDIPEDIRNDEKKSKKLFSFSPSVKGAVNWIDNKTIEFTPEEGALKQGTLYNAAFALGKVMNVEKKLSNFEFSFRVEERGFRVTTNPIEIQEDNSVVVRGELTFSDMVSIETVKKMISAKIGSRKEYRNREKDDFGKSWQS